MQKLRRQQDLIEEGDWDCLAVLDACRYDYFEKIYDDYLSGNLKKVVSPGSSTCEWLRKVFERSDYSDVVYVSASPYVNSKGSSVIKGFFKIIDVWDWGWDDDMKTIPPERVGKATRMARAKYPNHRIIAHFMQPHPPYLAIGPLVGGFKAAKGIRKAKKGGRSLAKKIRVFVGNTAGNIFGKLRIRKLGTIMNIGQPGSTESVAQRYGYEALRDVYKENLRAGLREVAKVAERLPGKVVITSDHGELLGENGVYGHISGVDDLILKEVPWLEIKSIK